MIVYQHSGLQGLEVWQGLARHATLFQLRDDPRAYLAGLAEFLHRLHAGTAASADGRDLSVAKGFERLIIAGGHAQAVDYPHKLIQDPFSSRAGAEAIWAEYGWQRPVAIDLGQSFLKIMTSTTQESFRREIPFELPEAEGRARLVQWMRASIGDFDGAVLALPNELTADGCANSSSYPGLHGPLQPLFSEVFEGRPWVVVNDAVLTARGYPGRSTLVLTMGFGVGAALWE